MHCCDWQAWSGQMQRGECGRSGLSQWLRPLVSCRGATQTTIQAPGHTKTSSGATARWIATNLQQIYIVSALHRAEVRCEPCIHWMFVQMGLKHQGALFITLKQNQLGWRNHLSLWRFEPMGCSDTCLILSSWSVTVVPSFGFSLFSYTISRVHKYADKWLKYKWLAA